MQDDVRIYSSFERMEQFKYFRTTLTYQNSIQEEINEDCSKKCLLSFDAESFVFHLLFKNTDIKLYRILLFSVILYGCETWSLIFREKRRLRVSENRVLRRIFGPKRTR
jgi:hypothetical protein